MLYRVIVIYLKDSFFYVGIVIFKLFGIFDFLVINVISKCLLLWLLLVIFL